MERLVYRAALCAMLFASLMVGACSNVDGQSAALTGKATDFSLETLDGGKFSLGETLKSKDAVLVFWTTWCPACTREVSDVQKYYQQHGKDVAVVGINIQESKNKVAGFADRMGISYPIALDAAGHVARVYNVRGIPTVIAINKKGDILYFGHDIAEMERKVKF